MTNENTNKPYPVKVREGKNYFICSCKLTKRQPFCDGAHIDTDNQPYMYKAEETKEIYFCGCKESKNFPFCDGTHNNIKSNLKLLDSLINNIKK